MKCPSCSFENPEGFGFCGQCGAKLVLTCANCGAEIPSGFAFCGKCGTRLEPEPPSALITETDLARLKPFLPSQVFEGLPPPPMWEERHLLSTQEHLDTVLDVVITYLPRHLVQSELAPDNAPPVGGAFLDGALLFSDISGFTAMSERLAALGKEGAEQITALANRYFSAMLEILFAHGGDLFKFGGDALLAFFSDDIGGGTSALLAANAMQQAMAAFHQVETSLGSYPLQMKIGLNAGALFVARVGGGSEKEFIVTGSTVNATAKAEGLASAGQILLSPTIYQQVKDQDWLTLSQGPAGHFLVERVISSRSPAPFSSPGHGSHLQTSPDDASEKLPHTLNALERLTPYLPPGLLPRLVPDPARHETSGEHRLVAVLFANYRGTSELIARLGRERAGEIAQALNQYFVTMQGAVARYGGVVNKVDLYDHGDKLMALFGAPIAHEDDAERAVRAALEMQAALESTGALPLSQQIGISNGLVFAGHVGGSTRREYTVMGDEVNLAARLMSAAQENEILLSSFVARKASPVFELADRGEVRLKGKSMPIPTFTIVGRRAQPEPVRGIRGLHSPLVGRADEEATLQRLVDELQIGRGNILSLVGEAGLGKSRLVAELRQRVVATDRPTWLEGRCLSFTQQVSYSAFTDLIRYALGIVDTDNEFDIRAKLSRRVEELLPAEAGGDILPYMARFLGLPPRGPEAERVAYLEAEALQRQILRSVAALLEGVAREHPLVLAFDDLHWADSASLALLERCLALTDRAPVLILLIYRPDRAHGCWTLGQTAARDYPHRFTEISLSPLDLQAGQDEQLVRNLLSLTQLPRTLIQLVSRAEGNPFYLEEIIRTLIDQGILARANGRWRLARRADLKTVPDTLQGIIMARVDRLMEEARRTLQLASVVGRTFRHQVLTWLSSAAALATHLDASLATLQRTELIRERSRLPELEFGFKHILIRDVAYESLLVRDRRTYHRLVAQHLEETNIGQKREEVYELLARHYSLSDEREKTLTYLIKAGDKARAAYANLEAIAFYRQAEPIAEELDRVEDQAAIAEGLGDVLFHIGEYDEALKSYERALCCCSTMAEEADLRRRIGLVHEKRGEYQAALDSFAQGMEILSAPTDGAVASTLSAELVRARLLTARCRAYWQQGQFEAALDNGQTALSFLESTTHYHEIAQCHNELGNTCIRYSQPSQAIARFEQALTIFERIGDEYEAARVYGNLGILYHQTDLDRSVACFTRTLETMQRLGNVWGEATALQNLGVIHYARGDYVQAIDFYHRSLEMKERLGDRMGIADCHINLGEVFRAQGHLTQAITQLEKGLAITREIGAGHTEVECHRQLAECYLESSETERALAACEEALAHAREIGDSKEQGIIYQVLGNAYLQKNDPASARAHLKRSVAISRELNQEYALGRALHDYAQALVQAGKTTLARRQLDEALSLFERLDLPQEQARVQAALDQLE